MIASQRARIFQGLAAALAYHGYEDTKITDVVEPAGVSRATFHERFESKERCFDEAYEEGVERLAASVKSAALAERDWVNRLSAGLRAGLRSLADDPALAHLLLVEALAAERPRLEHERSLERLAEVLRPQALGGGAEEGVSAETARLLAGGLASHLSGRVLAGEAGALPGDHELLLRYVLAPARAAAPGARRHAAQG
jgi:AcrR family transcriptional regulator